MAMTTPDPEPSRPVGLAEALIAESEDVTIAALFEEL